MKKDYFLIIDTETTQTQKVADFGAIICDRNGRIVTQIAVLVNGIFTDMENHPLFFTNEKEGIWAKKGVDKRYKMYNEMVASGSRMVASVAAINRWLERAAATYDPVLTAYFLSFDKGKCHNTGIDLTMFPRNFCLWSAAYTEFAHTRKFRELVLQLHAFNGTTEHGNKTYQTNAEIMTKFVTGQPDLEDEPHTALEDVIFYELPILKAILKKRSTKFLLEKLVPYNWREVQVKDWFKPK